MSLKLNGATSGSVELDVPAVVSGGDIALTLPDTAGDFMVKDASGNTDVTSINSLNFPTAGALSNRNLIINGSMEVAQRGISSTSNGYVSLDRWFVNQSGGSTTFSQETFAAGSEIGSLKNYAKFAVSTSSDFTHIRQHIEDVRTVPAGNATVSFWAKGTNPSGGLIVRMRQEFGSGGSTAVEFSNQTVTLTSSWQRFEVQFTVSSISGKTIGTNSFVQLSIGQNTDTGTTAWELDITGVQLEVGTVATPFEHISYGDELARCRRYFETTLTVAPANNMAIVDTGALAVSDASSGAVIQYMVKKRATPSLVVYAPLTTSPEGKVRNGNTGAITSIGSSLITASAAVFGTGTTANNYIQFGYAVSAEL